jgi:hypothetical protein
MVNSPYERQILRYGKIDLERISLPAGILAVASWAKVDETRLSKSGFFHWRAEYPGILAADVSPLVHRRNG